MSPSWRPYIAILKAEPAKRNGLIGHLVERKRQQKESSVSLNSLKIPDKAEPWLSTNLGSHTEKLHVPEAVVPANFGGTGRVINLLPV